MGTGDADFAEFLPVEPELGIRRGDRVALFAPMLPENR